MDQLRTSDGMLDGRRLGRVPLPVTLLDGKECVGVLPAHASLSTLGTRGQRTHLNRLSGDPSAGVAAENEPTRVGVDGALIRSSDEEGAIPPPLG